MSNLHNMPNRQCERASGNHTLIGVQPVWHHEQRKALRVKQFQRGCVCGCRRQRHPQERVPVRLHQMQTAVPMDSNKEDSNSTGPQALQSHTRASRRCPELVRRQESQQHSSTNSNNSSSSNHRNHLLPLMLLGDRGRMRRVSLLGSRLSKCLSRQDQTLVSPLLTRNGPSRRPTWEMCRRMRNKRISSPPSTPTTFLLWEHRRRRGTLAGPPIRSSGLRAGAPARRIPNPMGFRRTISCFRRVSLRSEEREGVNR